MTHGNFRRTLVGTAVVAALSVLGTPAGAAPYRGQFDPTDFAGEYIIDVSPACLAQPTGWYANAGICSASLQSAFANVISSSPEPTYTGQLTFTPPAISSSSILFGLYVYGGEIDSFDTTPIGAVGESPASVDNWWIQFISGHMPPPPCCYIDSEILGAPALANGVYLYANSLGSPIASAIYLGPAQFIPEPGTLGLALGALGGGWLASRRRKQKEANSS